MWPTNSTMRTENSQKRCKQGIIYPMSETHVIEDTLDWEKPLPRS